MYRSLTNRQARDYFHSLVQSNGLMGERWRDTEREREGKKEGESVSVWVCVWLCVCVCVFVCEHVCVCKERRWVPATCRQMCTPAEGSMERSRPALLDHDLYAAPGLVFSLSL